MPLRERFAYLVRGVDIAAAARARWERTTGQSAQISLPMSSDDAHPFGQAISIPDAWITVGCDGTAERQASFRARSSQRVGSAGGLVAPRVGFRWATSRSS